MKKHSIIIVLFSFIIGNANSQITKGNWILGGNVSFSHTNYNSNSYSKYKNTTFSLSPNFGYFVADKICTGLKVSIVTLRNEYTSTSDNGTITYAAKNRFYDLGPFVRYYFLPAENTVNLFAEGSYQYQMRKDIAPNSKSNQNGNAFAFNIGPAFYLNESVGVEFTVGYSSIKYKGSTGRDNTIQTNLGLQIHLQKDK